ncbi:hypothetical protein F5B20DRAFT_463681 [Whalleya microplaca]|nr:hypothetical protein F5B20DRAFT_463681 [Whalleya microplaca]
MEHPKSVAQSHFPPFSSPSDLLGDAQLHRRFVNIAKDQLELLDRAESWAQYLSRRPKGFVNVPPEVLQGLKESHVQKLHTIRSEKSIAPNRSRVDRDDHGADKPEPTGAESQGFQSQPEDGDDDNDDDSGTVVSGWSVSPEHKRRPPRSGSEQAEQPFITQIPQKSPPQPTVRTLPKCPAFNDFPSSSLGQEDELELEVPNAISDSVPPVGKTGVQIIATPPSAQIVPCTFEQPEQSPEKPNPKQKTRPKQRKYPGLPELYCPQNNGSASTHLNTGLTKTKPTGLSLTDVQSSTSTANTSSSIIPSTMHDETTSKRIPAWHRDQEPLSSKEVQASHESIESGNSLQTRQRSPEFKPSSPHFKSSPPVRPTSRPTPQSHHQESPPPPSPFIRYTVTYPSYVGSISDFVTACVYIQTQKRRLRTSLYDDFIRAWAEGYLQYVKDCDNSEPPVKALNAIGWYNEIDDDPLFTSRIVTRQNLESVINFYPDELRDAQNVLGLSPNPTPEVTQAPSAMQPMKELEPDMTMITISDTVNPAKPSRDLTEPGIQDGLPSLVPPAINATIPQHQGQDILSLHKSMSAIEKGPRGPKGLTRSLSEATSHKRKASDDPGSTAPKKVPTSFDKSDCASLTSEHSMTTVRSSVAPSYKPGEPMKYADNLDKRSRKFKNFVKRQKDRIASSAPVTNTPTSAQRQ